MSENTDWSAYVVEQQKFVTHKLSNVTISQTPNPSTASRDDAAAGAEEKELESGEVSLLQKALRTRLVTNKNDLEVQRKNPSSPLYSVKSFEALNLRKELIKGIYDMGFTKPSTIQETALPTLLDGHNLIAQAQSGTGKTAAFVLAILSRVDASVKYPQVLCLSPTYELALQSGAAAAKIGKHCADIQVRYAVRGEELPLGAKISEQILMGTPGKVLDWANKFKMFDLRQIRMFVLDEADVMIDTQGHQDQCIRIHKFLDKERCQMMFFSATYSKEIMEFAEIIVDNPVIIRLKREEESLDNIKQYYVRCPNEHAKYDALTMIYGTIGVGQAIIFCHTRRTASWLTEKMRKDGHAVALLSGEQSIEQRISVLDRFRKGTDKVLITTNVLSRGIDVEQVTIVVNFDLPMGQDGKADCETYLHRIGRTGRFGKQGIAINLVDGDYAEKMCKSIEQHFNKKIHLLNVDDSDEMSRLDNE